MDQEEFYRRLNSRRIIIFKEKLDAPQRVHEKGTSLMHKNSKWELARSSERQ